MYDFLFLFVCLLSLFPIFHFRSHVIQPIFALCKEYGDFIIPSLFILLTCFIFRLYFPPNKRNLLSRGGEKIFIYFRFYNVFDCFSNIIKMVLENVFLIIHYIHIVLSFVSLFNGISKFVPYLMSKPSWKNSNGKLIAEGSMRVHTSPKGMKVNLIVSKVEIELAYQITVQNVSHYTTTPREICLYIYIYIYIYIYSSMNCMYIYIYI